MRNGIILLAVFVGFLCFELGIATERVISAKLNPPQPTPISSSPDGLTADEKTATPAPTKPVYFEEITLKQKDGCSVVLSMPVKKGVRYFCEHERKP